MSYIVECVYVLLLLTAVLFYYKGYLWRFLAIHLLIFLGMFALASSLAVLLYSCLFETTLPILFYPTQVFEAYRFSILLQDGRFIIALALAFVLSFSCYGLTLLRLYFNVGKPLGKARFANGFTLYRAGLFAKKGFLLAKSFYGLLRHAGFEPMIVVAGTGGGKTSSLVLPNMLSIRDENIVVTDIKGEVYRKTHEFRRSIGDTVYRFEPASKETHCYNPLAQVRESHIDEDLDIIFKTLIPDSHDPLWADGSRNILKMLAMYYLLEKKMTPTFQQLFQDICDPQFHENIESLVDSIKTSRVLNLFNKLLSIREKTRKDLLLNAQEYLAKFDSPNLAHATGSNDIWFNDLRCKKMTVYLVMPANTQTYGAIAAIFVEQMLRICAEYEPKPGDKSINVIIDEFANLPKMPSLLKGITYLRSYRIRVCAFVQQIAQLDAVYQSVGKKAFMASPIQIAFNVTSYEDAKYFSSCAGKKTIRVKNDSTNQNMGFNISTNKQYRDLISPEEVMRLSVNKLLIYRKGYNLIFRKKYYKPSL